MRMIIEAAAIGAAGFVGAILRYAVGGLIGKIAPADFPFGTWIINLSGCFLLAVVLTLLRDRATSDTLRLAIAVGFIGSYTTYSTFAYESYELIRQQQTFRAASYIAATVVLGLGAVWCGVQAAHRIEKQS